MSTDQAAKVRENLLRRMAERQGLMLRKSLRRDPLALGYGRYYVTSRADWREVVAGTAGGVPDWTLDDAEKWLRGENRGGAR